VPISDGLGHTARFRAQMGSIVRWRSHQAVRHVVLPTRQVSREYPTLPRTDDGLGWNVGVLAELHAGKQSRVLDGLLNGNRSAIKLTESRLTNFAVLTSRTGAEAVGMLGAAHPSGECQDSCPTNRVQTSRASVRV
jgi:hypothetical protein